MELLASEEDTVTVGQDLFVIEAGEGTYGLSSFYHLYLRPLSIKLLRLLHHKKNKLLPQRSQRKQLRLSTSKLIRSSRRHLHRQKRQKR